MSYQTVCPMCGSDCLVVVSFSASTWIPLRVDGFSTDEAKRFDTEDEVVECSHCEARFPLHTLDWEWLISHVIPVEGLELLRGGLLIDGDDAILIDHVQIGPQSRDFPVHVLLADGTEIDTDAESRHRIIPEATYQQWMMK